MKSSVLFHVLTLLVALTLLFCGCSPSAPEVASPAQQAGAPAEETAVEETPAEEDPAEETGSQDKKLEKLMKQIEEDPDNIGQLLVETYGSLYDAAATGNREVCRLAMPQLIENGFFSEDGAWGYVSSHGEQFYNCVDFSTADTVLEGVAFLRDNITPQLLNLYSGMEFEDLGEHICRMSAWSAWQNLCEDFPMTPEDVTPVPCEDGAAKYLFLRRAEGNSSEAQPWGLDVEMQAALPAQFAPATLAEVTHLIIIDTAWEYAFSYSEGTEAYKAVTTVTVKSSEGETSLDTLEERPDTVVPYFGDTPTAIHAQIWHMDIYNSIADQLGFYE